LGRGEGFDSFPLILTPQTCFHAPYTFNFSPWTLYPVHLKPWAFDFTLNFNPTKRKVLSMLAIIGSKGQLGWELVRQGEARGLGILARDCPEIDISDLASIDACLDSADIDLVVNAAAYTAVDRAESEPQAAFAVNRDGPANLAKKCRDRHIPLIHVSTDYVFDGTKPGAYIEEDPVAPLGTYGASKAAGEEEVRGRLPEHIILRTAWLCGFHGHNFVKTILKLGRKKEILRVVSDQFGCPTFAADLGEAILKMAAQVAKNRSASWGTYHYCGAGKTTWHHFAKTIFEIARQYEKFAVKEVVPISTAEYPTPVKRPANSVLDCSKIERHFGIRPRPWKESLAEMIEQLYKLNAHP
jgi:dTDP-4-dehydrorhamnose reductase